MKRCSVCCHPDRARIDQELLAAAPPLRTVAQRYGLSKTALIRHQKAHIPEMLLKATNAAEVASADGLMLEVQHIMSDCRRIQTAAEAEGDLRCALAALATMGKQVETLAKLALAQQAIAPGQGQIDLAERLEQLRGARESV